MLHMLAIRFVVLTVATALSAGADTVPVSLSGSPESMARQHRVAVESGFRFLHTPAEVRRALAAGELVRVRGGRNFAVKHSAEAVTRPEVAHFVDRFSARYRSACGEPLVVTSLTRPRTRQPRNAHPLSVHPAGMAMDLRVPRRAPCRRWMERALLELEHQGLLDATLERSPLHFHVALFPGPYLASMDAEMSVQPRVVEAPAAPAGEASAPVATQALP